MQRTRAAARGAPHPAAAERRHTNDRVPTLAGDVSVDTDIQGFDDTLISTWLLDTGPTNATATSPLNPFIPA